MGLDMYLYVEQNIHAYDYEHREGGMTRVDNPKFDSVIKSAGLDTLPSGEYGAVQISKCVGYWRKANAIHGWIVRNCAGGEDNCQRINLTPEDLTALRDSCVKELANRGNALPDQDSAKAIKLDDNGDPAQVVKSLIEHMNEEAMKHSNTITTTADPLALEPTAGFFFGGTAKDEYYYHTLEYTVELLNSLIAGLNWDEQSIYYEASW